VSEELPPSAVLEVNDLHVEFVGRGRSVKAVNGVTFDLNAGETLGIVGESGSGKSAVLRSLIGLHALGTTNYQGSIRYAGEELLGAGDRTLRRIRGAEIAMIFQDPMSYLNPVLRVDEQIGETLRRHTGLSRQERSARAVELLRLVGISAPEHRLRQYPHQLSGGMRQRVIIAIALACEPRVLLADEPTTALDVTIQDQILTLLADLRRRLGMSMVLVSHDLGVIAQTCDRVLVMYGGQVVELASVADVLRLPRHPYTAGLLRCLPGSVSGRFLHAIPGMPPRLTDTPVTCTFRPRCELAVPECENWSTSLLKIDAGRASRCLKHDLVRVDG
jgi:peptide/nickel transport system ATP-binding protein/oligopeptide transport system ATP-binding protein